MAVRGGSNFLGYWMGAAAFWSLRVLAGILPYSVFRSLGRSVLACYYVFAGRKMRKVATESLSVAFGNTISDEDKKRISNSAADSLLNGFIGHAYSIWHRGFSDLLFSLDGKDRLDAGLKRGKGAVIAVAHFGPFSWMIFKFIDLGYRVNVVMRPPRNSYLWKKFRDSGDICGMNIIYSVPVRGCVVECTQALERGELVFMPVDQNYGGAGRVFVDFFGRPAATAPGPVIFASKLGAPMFFAYALPCNKGSFRITVSPEIGLEQGGSGKEGLIANTARVTKMVEDVARQYPEEWSWMHKRWKAVPREGEL